jgi:HAD superfamily hydrolase (TIGR01509 family)
MTWILIDQAGVMTHLVFTLQPTYSINNKTFPAKQLESIFVHPIYKDYLIGNIQEKQFIQSFLKDNALNLTVDEYIQLFKSSIIPIKGMYDLLTALKSKYKLAALINEGREWAQYKLLDFGQFFEHIIISGEIGLAKPDERFFEKALSTIKAPPEDCIFTDDIMENCFAAESVGIKSILFQNADQLREELKLMGINI